MRLALLILLTARFLPAQTAFPIDSEGPAVVVFVSPAYPRVAKDSRIMGTAVTNITVSPEGRVIDAKIVSAHPVFANYVLSALKQWQFQKSKAESRLEVKVQFELLDDCSEGTNQHPLTPETYVSAELPGSVHVKTAVQCIETSNSHKQR